MKKWILLLGISVAVFLGACRGKQGEPGALGPGSTEIINGTVSATSFNIVVPSLTSMSSFQVLITSDSVHWVDWNPRYVDIPGKIIQMDVTAAFVGGTYRAIVENAN